MSLGRLATVLLAGLGLSACVGPDFERPPAPAAEGYTADALPPQTAAAEGSGGTAQRFVAGRDIPAQWWTLFRSPALDGLIKQALAANPTIQAGEAALRAAHEAADAQRGAFFPSISGSFGSNRTKNAGGATSANSTASSAVANLHTAQLTLGYAPDVWGGTWRQVESLDAQEESQRFQLEATQLTLATNVVIAAINEAMLRGQISAQRDIIAAGKDSLAIQRKALALGQIAEADVAAQDAALAQAEAGLPPLDKQLAVQRDALAALLGRLPSQPPAETFELAALHLPEDLPVSLPAQLVNQRPDIRQAEANLHAASAAIGVAIAARTSLFSASSKAGGVLPGAARVKKAFVT